MSPHEHDYSVLLTRGDARLRLRWWQWNSAMQVAAFLGNDNAAYRSVLPWGTGGGDEDDPSSGDQRDQWIDEDIARDLGTTMKNALEAKSSLPSPLTAADLAQIAEWCMAGGFQYHRTDWFSDPGEQDR